MIWNNQLFFECARTIVVYAVGVQHYDGTTENNYKYNSAVVNAPEATFEPRICPHLQLQRLHDDSLKWKCSLKINDVDDETGESMTRDLCQCLANGWGLKFPATYRGLAARKHLVVQLKMAALLSGFCLCTRSSAAERSCGNIRRRAHVILCCTKVQLHQPAEDKGNPKSSNQNTKPSGKPGDTSFKTRPTKVKKMMVSRPIQEKDVCSFHFSIYMVSRWFLSPTNVNRSTCSWHCGHKRLDPSLLPNQISNMSEDEQVLAKQCLQLHFTASAVATLLTERNILSLRYSSDQLAYLSRVHRDAVFGLTSNASTADRLITTFAKRKDVSWMMASRPMHQQLIA
ncbi:hypothetical protein IV203_018349 [Nitzschia inconspicua]|uniref:Uncharacterized protein n=1 Tax=Nitzschia inconspicua TaxID=303405 RepID=A0A9K3Q6A7_9STRA|nr:hypothetical protein IV203_018349 [Nitzschia inconspicua]